jgi:hypothetical protein
LNPDLIVDTEKLAVAESVEAINSKLRELDDLTDPAFKSSKITKNTGTIRA